MYNSRLHLFSGKLRSKRIGLFLVKKIFPHGAVEIKNPSNDIVFKVNGKKLKPFLKLTKESTDEAMVLYEPTYLD